MNQQISVTKRDGRVVPFKIESIRTAIDWATDGLGLNGLELESAFQLRLKDGISTSLIQDSLVDCAVSLTTPEEPDWRYVAGRMSIWSYIKNTIIYRGFGYGDYVSSLNFMVDSGYYDTKIFELYTRGQLARAGNWIRDSRDKDYDIAGASTLKKYLYPGELPQETFLTIALLIAGVEKTPEKRLEVAKDIYETVSLRKISLASPILGNMRTPTGNGASCFILSISDSLESIFANLTNAARISKAGGGVGVNISKVRAKGSVVNKRPNSSGGVVPWIKLFNDTALSVNQGKLLPLY